MIQERQDRESESFILELRSVPDRSGVPPIVRLRRLLKASLRGYGFRATLIEPASGKQPAEDSRTFSGIPESREH